MSNLNGQLRTDPTRTITLRRRFMTEMDRRFKAVAKEIEAAVVELDVFGLKERSHSLNILFNPYHDDLGRFATGPGGGLPVEEGRVLSDIMYHSGIDIPTKSLRAGTFFTPDLQSAELFQRNFNHPKLHAIRISDKKIASEVDVKNAVKHLGFFEKGTPTGQYFERDIFGDSNVSRLLNLMAIKGFTSAEIFDGMSNSATRVLLATSAIRDVDGLKHNSIVANLEPRQFEFVRSDQKINLFMRWLDEMVRKHILTVTARADTRVGEAPWTNLYIQSAYQQGIARGRSELRKKGYDVPSAKGADFTGKNPVAVAFNQPFHADRVAIAYTRAFNELQGITKVMDQQVSRVLAQGLAEGQNPYEMARNLVDRVIGLPGINGMSARTRARTLARTEVVSAHHQATINEYEVWGASGVTVQAEWLTAGFGVCPICAPRQGKIYSLEQVRGMIPVHPNCRCCAIPVVKGT